MTRIVGLDLSLTATGIQTWQGPPYVITAKGLTGMERIDHIRRAIGTAMDDPIHIGLVLIEGYSFASANSHAHALGELGGLVRWTLWTTQTPYIDVPPASLKRFATGKGNAGKDAMVATAARAGCLANDNNAVDAWWLWQFGMYLTGDPKLPRTAYRDDAIGPLRSQVNTRAEVRRRIEQQTPSCESCGARAHVRLDDDSTWCLSCDDGARRAGYDQSPGTIIP